MRCWFGFHKWVARSAQLIYSGLAWQSDERMSPATLILYTCGQCGNSKTETRQGHWKLDDLLGGQDG